MQARIRHRDIARASGFSMVELVVALGILAVVVAGVMESFVVQNRAYQVVDQTTESQQNLRAVSHLLERDLRMTGFMVSEAAVVCGIDANNAPDEIWVTDSDVVDPTNQSSAGLGARVTSMYSGAVNTLMTLAVDDVVLDANDGDGLDVDGYYDTNGDGMGDSDFRIGGGVILVDLGNPGRGTACGVVDHVTPPGALRVEFLTTIGAGGSNLRLIPAHRYQVDADGDLLRDGMTLASDIDDLQVAYFVDSDGNGDWTATPNEYRGAYGSFDYDPQGTDHSDLREIRFNLVLRTRAEDPLYESGFMQATENRAAAGVPDGFRRRLLTTTVRPRNIGFRGQQSSG
jgi:type II secretory pathway pseudopilin PulG